MGKFELPLPNDNDQHDEIFFDETVLPETPSFDLFKKYYSIFSGNTARPFQNVLPLSVEVS